MVAPNSPLWKVSNGNILQDLRTLQDAHRKFIDKWQGQLKVQRAGGPPAPPGWPGVIKGDTAINGFGANMLDVLTVLEELAESGPLSPAFAKHYWPEVNRNWGVPLERIYHWIDSDMHTHAAQAWERVEKYLEDAVRG